MGNKGMTLLETIVSILILSIAGLIFISGFTTVLNTFQKAESVKIKVMRSTRQSIWEAVLLLRKRKKDFLYNIRKRKSSHRLTDPYALLYGTGGCQSFGD